MNERLTLYHGTSEASAARLLAEGWTPNSAPPGNQCGDPRFLYLTDEPADALWFANEKGSDVVLEIEVESSHLMVDPDDGMQETVKAELASEWPAKLVISRPVPPDAISRWTRRPGFTI